VLSISVILPTHDRPEFLLEALQCVRRQTHPELELILVRDGGGPHSDDVRALLGQFEFPVTLIEHDGDSGGAARARNQGVERARGDAIAFIDDDDLWEPGHAYALAGALESHPEADVVYSDSVILNTATDGTRILARDFDAGRFVRDGFIPPSAMAARREAFERFGPFDPEFTLTEDWEWLIRVVRGGGVLRARLHLAERAHNPRSKVLAEDPKSVRIGTARLRDLASLIEMFRSDLEGRHSDIVRAFMVKVGDRDTYIAARVMVRDIAHSLEPFRESPEFSS
jgi:glycosyltransferase involved in cell wall biosynthesis